MKNTYNKNQKRKIEKEILTKNKTNENFINTNIHTRVFMININVGVLKKKLKFIMQQKYTEQVLKTTTNVCSGNKSHTILKIM